MTPCSKHCLSKLENHKPTVCNCNYRTASGLSYHYNHQAFRECWTDLANLIFFKVGDHTEGIFCLRLEARSSESNRREITYCFLRGNVFHDYLTLGSHHRKSSDDPRPWWKKRTHSTKNYSWMDKILQTAIWRFFHSAVDWSASVFRCLWNPSRILRRCPGRQRMHQTSVQMQ